MPDEIANQLNLCSSCVREKFNARKFILDQYQQFKLIEPIKAKIVSEVRFICHLLDINGYILRDNATNFISGRLWRVS